MLIGHLAMRWWTLTLRGLVAIAFGILAVSLPRLTVGVLVALFGAFALVDGISAVASGLRVEDHGHDWALVLLGIAGIVAGLVAWSWPGITALALLALIATWAIVTGGLEIAAAFRLRSALHHEWLLAFDGLLSVAFGLVALAFPRAGVLAIAWLIGAWAFVSGVSLVVLGFRLRSHAERFVVST